MKRLWFSAGGLALLLVIFLGFSVVNSYLFTGVRLDLTQQHLYTLSKGTKNIIHEVKEPINLYFFFSDKQTQGLSSLRNYAENVREILRQYEKESNGKIKLTVIDPVPFSEEEDKAAEFGLQKVPLNQGEEIYFGLVGSNSTDGQEILPFFQIDQQEYLEYDISKMLQKLTHPKLPKMNMLTGLTVAGDMNLMTQQQTPPWAVTDNLKQLFDFRKITDGAPHIDPDANLVMLVQPKQMTDEQLYEVDQFVMKGGKAIVFVDPVAETDQGTPPEGTGVATTAQSLSPLLKAWGVRVRDNQVVADMQQALPVSVGDSTEPVRHLGLLGITGSAIASNHVITAGLERVNVSTAGIIDSIEGATTKITPLLSSSKNAMPMEASQFKMLRDPKVLYPLFSSTNQTYTIAALIQGPAKSMFTQGREGAPFVAENKNINVMVVADTDILSDRLWVSTQEYSGQQVSQPWADNGSFVINAVDYMTGSQDLIDVRSRGRFSRPFDVVDDLRRHADEKFHESEARLEKQLSDAESQLKQLEDQKDLQGTMVLTPDQEKAVAKFQDERAKIRKELRDVKHQLNSDIETLGTSLKIINIMAMPLLITLFILGLVVVRRRQKTNK